jgi:UDP-N-acetylmuramoyl-tripeptide--D-alanyl-D-alanine ligase
MHIEHLGSQEGILKAKLEILEGMKPDGQVILNGDDALLINVHKKSALNVTYFGVRNPDCKVRASNVEQTQDQLKFTAQWGDNTMAIAIPLEGTHYVPDALAAICVGLDLGVSPEKIQERLAFFHNLAGRQEILNVNGYTIIKDCYNAGPESMAAALRVLGKKPGRHVAVLGDMLELGVCTQAEHYRVGRIAAENADLVLSYGPNSDRVISGAITGGMKENKALAFTDRNHLIETLKRLAKPGDVLLFKGSHGMHMELALEGFLKEDT